MKRSRTTIQTRKNLMDAFWEIYSTQGLKKATVGAITKKAGYNRSTFYEYFSDVQDILNQMEDEFLHDLEARIASVADNQGTISFDGIFEIFRIFFFSDDKKLLFLLSRQENFCFREKLRATMNPFFQSALALDPEDPVATYVEICIMSSMLGLLNYWTHWEDVDKKVSLNELHKIVKSLMRDGVLQYFHHGEKE